MKKFAEGLVKVIEKRMEERSMDSVSIQVQDINKNNVIRTGLVFKGDGDIAPVIYIDNFYDDFFQNDLSINEIADRIIDTYCEGVENKKEMENLKNQFTNYDFIKNKLIVCAYNKSKNPYITEQHPVFNLIGDIGLYCRFEISNDGKGICSAKINNELLSSYGIDQAELFADAFNSMKALHPCEINDIIDILCKNMPEEIKGMFDDKKGDMFVISNNVGMFGSVYGFDEEILNFFCNDKHEESVYILPSSINECILIPGSKCDNDSSRLNDIVKDVNQQHVPDEEFLSDMVFVYNRADNELRVVEC